MLVLDVILFVMVTHVTVSSIYPRVNPGKPTFAKNIDTVYTGIPVLCQEDPVTLVDNDQATHLADGSINDRHLKPTVPI